MSAQARSLRPPMPYFGSKVKVAAEVWRRFGDVANYVEPFAGSLAILLARPDSHEWWRRTETCCDTDGFIPNFFRALAAVPDEVAAHASWPVTEADLTSRHLWLVQNRDHLTDQLMRDPTFYDARAAGWWVWGVCAWVGGDWCTSKGPFTGTDQPSLTNGGTAPGVYLKVPMISGGHGGKGVHRRRKVGGETLSPTGNLVPDVTQSVADTLQSDFRALANRLRRVRVICGNWDRVLGNAATPPKRHVTGVFLDPPYSVDLRRTDLYGVGDCPDDPPVHVRARDWALDHTDDPRYRIAYCCYSTRSEDALFEKAGWAPHRWTASGGYGLRAQNRARSNKRREIIWFSPSCLPGTEPETARDAATLPFPDALAA